ncbi:glycosyltransferase family 2 protein [Notoacmeibacter sp. MSK16QG-6]|nr:glycosyltransferase family 2 protein [Notoacmeibacter sp. MSK16QG-6]
MPSLLKHYRELGVDRFVIVDDQSDDGTVEFLKSESDVDLWSSEKRFAESARGKIWRERLMALYGFDRWYINIDSDEYLIFPLEGAMPLKDYLAALTEKAIRRVAAPMIDFYPDGPLSDAIFDGSDARMPWDVAPLFDESGYSGVFEDSGAILRGGVRQRVFGTDMHLMKYPIIYWDRSCTLGASIHWPTPTARNVTSEWGVLLHFKIFSDVDERAATIIENGQHMNDAAVYKTIRQHLQKEEEPSLRYEGSVHFSSAADLRQRGFLQSVVTKN